MATLTPADNIVISQTDTRLLVALLGGPASTYRLKRQAEIDLAGKSLSNGVLQPSLKGLLSIGLVVKGASGYKISGFGRFILEQELERWGSLSRLAKKRGL